MGIFSSVPERVAFPVMVYGAGTIVLALLGGIGWLVFG